MLGGSISHRSDTIINVAVNIQTFHRACLFTVKQAQDHLIWGWRRRRGNGQYYSITSELPDLKSDLHTRLQRVLNYNTVI